jgi:hypothetical protein
MAEYAQDDHALNLVSLGSKGIPTSRTANFTDTGYLFFDWREIIVRLG